jgi:transcription elongation factor Elf1
MTEDASRVDHVDVDCLACGAKLLVSAARHEPAKVSTFAVYCSRCGKRVPLPLQVGIVRSVSLRD